LINGQPQVSDIAPGTAAKLGGKVRHAHWMTPEPVGILDAFMVLYRSDVSARDQMAGASAEQAQAGMDAWMAWAAKAGEAIVDLGSPLAEAAYLGAGSAGGSSGNVTGFSILQAESADAVKSVLDGHPHLEVLEFLSMPGM
jgi:hypothetical protein